MFFYFSISHARLFDILDAVVANSCSEEEVQQYITSQRGNGERFLSCTPYAHYSLPIASAFGRLLSQIYLLSLLRCFDQHTVSFLYSADDFLLFFKTKRSADSFYYSVLLPLLQKYNLSLQIEKTQMGTVKGSVSFLGYVYRAGYFAPEAIRIQNFYTTIHTLVLRSVRNQRSMKSCIRVLNKKILGFCHYYI